MRRATRFLVGITLLALLVPLVPWVLFGARIDRLVADWLDPPPPPLLLAALEVGVLAVDILLPVPSSVVATLGGGRWGIAAGSLCAWLGMTAGSLAGWWLGRKAGGRHLDRLQNGERALLRDRGQTAGPMIVVLSRPLPLLAEAVALAAGGAGMPLRTFAMAAAAGNAVIAVTWSWLGAAGEGSDAVPLSLLVALVVPVALAWGAVRLWRPHR